MPEITGIIRKSKVLTLFINEIIFGKSKNRFGTIPGRNIKIMITLQNELRAHYFRSLGK